MSDGERIGRSHRCARQLSRLLLAAAAVAVVLIGFVPLTTPSSQAAVIEDFITVAPTSGPVNTTVTISLQGLWHQPVTAGPPIECTMSWLWNGAPWTTTGTAGTGHGGTSGETASGDVPASAVPGAVNTIQALCTEGTNTYDDPTTNFTVTPTWRLTDSPASATAGTAVTVLLTGSNNARGNPPCPLTYTLDGSNPSKQSAPRNYVVPASTPAGVHTFKIVCSTLPLSGSATVTFTLNPPATTTTTRGTSTTSKSTSTTAKGATTTTGKGSTTTAKGSTSSSSTSSSVPGSTSVSIDTTPTTVPGEAPVTSNTYLKLTALAIAPGAQVAANGKGCDAGAPVALSIGSRSVGHTRASSSGAFHAPLTLGPLAVGRYTVVAHCGPILAAPLDIVLASQVSAATSTLAIIIFALLIGALAFRRQIFPRRPTTTQRGADGATGA